ncbi:SsrA-binding protein SmpB [Brackiella oedipodis]|uniref:SsrA-binding protein SmpB n=1 Tax=Brackiella oedipodis TaxID=124225 RepID=UPI0004918AB4|nr:SsrA-binding protein SmpB [Brackiella oedipodis]
MAIAENRKSRHDYFIEDQYEAGLVLEGWEVKAIRAARVQMSESYVIVRDAQLYVINMHISPLETASTHIHPNATRTRKLLLHRQEINRLMGKVDIRGYTLVPLNLHYKHGKIKMDIGLGKGKKTHDKRATLKDRDWQREKQRMMKHDLRNR